MPSAVTASKPPITALKRRNRAPWRSQRCSAAPSTAQLALHGTHTSTKQSVIASVAAIRSPEFVAVGNSSGRKVAAAVTAIIQVLGLANWNSTVLAARAYEQRWLLAPGSLFSPGQLPSSWLRFNLAFSSHPDLLRFLEETLAESPSQR